MSRATLVNLHLGVAAGSLPFVLMFLVTGGLYTLGERGTTTERKHTIAIDAQLPVELDAIAAVARAELDRLQIGPPSGSPTLRKSDRGWDLAWSGVARDVALRPGTHPAEAVLVVQEASLHKRFVQLHKAKGSGFAKVLSVGVAIALLVTSVTGLMLVFASAKLRRLACLSGLAGATMFAVYALHG